MNTATNESNETPTVALARIVQPLDEARAVTVRDAFGAMFDRIEEWQAEARNLVVTAEDQTGKMKRSRLLRLEIREARIGADKKRKAMKAGILVEGRAIDGAFAVFEGLASPLEKHLLEQEQFAERAEAARRDVLREARAAALVALGTDPAAYADVGAMAEETWSSTLRLAQEAHEARVEAAKQEEAIRIEAERIAAQRREEARAAAAKAEAERVERERAQAEENERLRVEAQKREAEIAAEREAARVASAAAEAEREAEREAARVATEKAAAEVRAERAAARAAEEARAAEVRAERERAAAAEAKLAEERARTEREEKARAEAEEARQRAEAKAREEAALAPDREKLVAFAAALRALPRPVLTSERGRAFGEAIEVKLGAVAAWIEAQAKKAAG